MSGPVLVTVVSRIEVRRGDAAGRLVASAYQRRGQWWVRLAGMPPWPVDGEEQARAELHRVTITWVEEQ